MRSRLYIEDAIVDKKNQLGKRDNSFFFPCIVVQGNRKTVAFFTDAAIQDAIRTAEENPEDNPNITNFFAKIKEWFHGKTV